MLRKIFPYYAESSFFNSFSIVLISEGYLESEKGIFTVDCLEFVDRLMKTAPFNLTHINNNWLSVYTSFTPSANSGTSINSSVVPGRTAFDSSVNTGSGLISVDQQKLNNYINAEEDESGDRQKIGKRGQANGKRGQAKNS
jgi:hypothetical protein